MLAFRTQKFEMLSFLQAQQYKEKKNIYIYIYKIKSKGIHLCCVVEKVFFFFWVSKYLVPNIVKYIIWSVKLFFVFFYLSWRICLFSEKEFNDWQLNWSHRPFYKAQRWCFFSLFDDLCFLSMSASFHVWKRIIMQLHLALPPPSLI